MLDQLPDKVMTTLPWSSQLASAVTALLAHETWTPTVHSMRPVTDDVLEIVFSWPDDDDLRGMRLDRKVFDAATGRLMGSTVDEIAFDAVLMGICEPRDMAEFGAADTTGVRWLPLSDWIEDIS
jgi:hypothetical protein